MKDRDFEFAKLIAQKYILEGEIEDPSIMNISNETIDRMKDKLVVVNQKIDDFEKNLT